MAKFRINAHCVFLLDASCDMVGNCSWGVWTSQWRRLSMWQLFRMDGDSGDFFLSQWPLQEVWRWWRLLPEALSISSCDFTWSRQCTCKWMCSPVVELKIQTWGRPDASAFQRQPDSEVRQICRQIISAQCGECSDGVDIDMRLLCVTTDLKDMCTCT